VAVHCCLCILIAREVALAASLCHIGAVQCACDGLEMVGECKKRKRGKVPVAWCICVPHLWKCGAPAPHLQVGRASGSSDGKEREPRGCTCCVCVH